MNLQRASTHASEGVSDGPRSESTEEGKNTDSDKRIIKQLESMKLKFNPQLDDFFIDLITAVFNLDNFLSHVTTHGELAKL